MNKFTSIVWIPEKIRIYRSGWFKLIDMIFPKYKVNVNGGNFIASSDDGVITSKDGIVWTKS